MFNVDDGGSQTRHQADPEGHGKGQWGMVRAFL